MSAARRLAWCVVAFLAMGQVPIGVPPEPQEPKAPAAGAVGVEISGRAAPRIAFVVHKARPASPSLDVVGAKYELVIAEGEREVTRVPVPRMRLCACPARKDHVEGDVVIPHEETVVVLVPWVTGGRVAVVPRGVAPAADAWHSMEGMRGPR